MENTTLIVAQKKDDNTMNNGERSVSDTRDGVNSWLKPTHEIHVIPTDNDSFEVSGSYVSIGACPNSKTKVITSSSNPNVIEVGKFQGKKVYGLKEDYHRDKVTGEYDKIIIEHPVYPTCEDAFNDYNKELNQGITSSNFYSWCLSHKTPFKPWNLEPFIDLGSANRRDRWNESDKHEEQILGTSHIYGEIDSFVNASENFKFVASNVGGISPDGIARQYLNRIRKDYNTELKDLQCHHEYYDKLRDVKYVFYNPKTTQAWKYNTELGCYEKIDFNVISTELYKVAKQVIADTCFDAAKDATYVEDGKPEEAFPWMKFLTKGQEASLKERCDWFYTRVTSLHKDAIYALKHNEGFIKHESLKGKHSNFVNLKNGVLNMTTKELLPHSPHYEFTYQNEGSYLGNDVSIKPTKILEFYNAALKNPDLHIDTIRSAVLVGLTGRGALTQCFIELTGKPGSGKGTSQKLITFAVGADNTYGTKMERLSNKFETVAYIDKLHLRIGDASKFLNDRVFLMVTGADELAIEEKGKSITENRAFQGVVTVSSNSPIMISDSSLAIERRRILVAFNPRQGKERTLLELVNNKWTGELADELDAFVTWCLNMNPDDSVAHLRKAKLSTDSSRVEAFIDSNTVAAFLNDSIIKDEEGFIPTQLKDITTSFSNTDNPTDLYSAFVNWSEQENPKSKIMSSREFSRNLKSLLEQPSIVPFGLSYGKHRKRDACYNLRGLTGARLRGSSMGDFKGKTETKQDDTYSKYPRFFTPDSD